ncbi:hypothetical protein CHS0354_002385 [Potamilus streckersoni]|uniref:C-type lectin domain-containing protein n=1 Tax=Potamilus streckersoni TaxID=2493646 RepID=A0AAE0RUF8_9BIVA|nr:hypothetical protein CHS0354_002385 [Potamilus streckersoni]
MLFFTDPLNKKIAAMSHGSNALIMSTNRYSRDNIQCLILFLLACVWILAYVEGTNTTVIMYSGLTWDEGRAECRMKNSRLPNVSFELIPENLPEKYNTTPVWVDVTYVNKTVPVSSGQEIMQAIYKCMIISKVSGSFFYRLDSCTKWNRVLCGNPPLAELYPGKQFSWVAAQKICQIAKTNISNMNKLESEKRMTEGFWYWMFDVRNITFYSEFAKAKDKCGYLVEGKVAFRDCTDSMPITLCIGGPNVQINNRNISSSAGYNDLKVILIALFVSLVFVSGTIVIVICFIRSRQCAKESMGKYITSPNNKWDQISGNSKSNGVILTHIGRKRSLIPRLPSTNAITLPEQKENKTVRAITQ